MADTRAADSEVDSIGSLKAQLDDLRSTLLARVSRCPTGDIEPTIRTAAKPDTLLMQGQTVTRTDYPVLWQWVQDQALIVTGLFTVGDGSTTFGIPDFRGRVIRGVAASGEAVGAKLGTDSLALVTANMPVHKHSVAVDDHDLHSHGGHTSNSGDHPGHGSGGTVLVPEGSFYGVLPGNPQTDGDHGHSLIIDSNPVSAHVVTESNVGSGTAVDMRQASIAVNWLVWT